MNKEQKTLKSCYILDRLREWFELYGNQNHQRAEEELHLVIDELYEYQQKDRQLADLETKLAEKDKEIISLECVISEIHNDIKELQEFKIGEDEYDLTDSDTRFSLECELLNKEQDKISFCIERLEKVKELLLEKCGETYSKTYCGIDEDIEEIIGNQINELKGGK